MSVQKIYDNILNKLLHLREENPNFTFWLRRKGDGLNKGYWFHGTEFYVSVGLVKMTSGNLSTKSIALHFDDLQGQIKGSILLENRLMPNTKTVNFYDELASLLTPTEKKHLWYKTLDRSDGINSIMDDFWKFYPKLLDLIEKHDLVSQMLVSNVEFNKSYQKVKKFQVQLENKQMNNAKMSLKKYALNQILYGPPGTGKTYILQNEYFPLFKDSGKRRAKEEFEAEIISQLSWWKVIALILLENEKMSVPAMKAHRFTKYKLAASNTNSLNQTFWGQLSSHTVEESTTVEYSSRSKTLVFNKEEEGSIWYIEESKRGTLLDLSMVLSEISNYQEESNDKDNYSFVTFHQSYGYEDFVIGIKPVLEDESDDTSEDVSYSLAKGIFYKACDEASKLAGYLSLKDAIENSDKEERKQRFSNAKRYGLFIDEINRGNVSAIFGELITLIEEDKRVGAKNEMILDIPNSKNKFGVPLNLHIIGTMNTADRSVEALDTALRRRFAFEEMLPKPELLSPSAMLSRFMWENEKLDWKDPTYLEAEDQFKELFKIPDGDEWNKRVKIWSDKMYLKDRSILTHLDHLNKVAEFSLEKLLKCINERIEVLVDRDHTIGHAFFMEVRNLDDLRLTFANKVIPLLQEYFYGDYSKMEMVIGSQFFNITETKNVKFAVKSDNFDPEGKVYHIKNISDKTILNDDAFKSALENILKTAE